jgi:hypothetical protein
VVRDDDLGGHLGQPAPCASCEHVASARPPATRARRRASVPPAGSSASPLTVGNLPIDNQGEVGRELPPGHLSRALLTTSCVRVDEATRSPGTGGPVPRDGASPSCLRLRPTRRPTGRTPIARR